ncbi:MAG: lactonase family protein [Caldimonas sp.]
MTNLSAARPRAFVYVANADSHDISVLALDSVSGELAEVERHAVGGVVMPLAASADGRFLYASIRSEPLRVVSFAIDAATGRLAEIGSAPLPASMCWISIDQSGHFLMASSYSSSVVAVAPIGSDGVVQAATHVVPTEANAHSVQVDPTNRFAFAACLGGGLIRQWRFDAETGALVDNVPPSWPARPGAGPRHFVFHPKAPWFYLLNELDAGLDVLALDAERGTLTAVQSVSALPPGFDAGEPWAADIHITRDGRFLYASERRSNTLAAFAVDAATGRLTVIGSVATEAQPRGFALTPDDRFLFAVGQTSHRLSRYAIDPQSGALAKLGDQGVGQNPNWVEIVVLPE